MLSELDKTVADALLVSLDTEDGITEDTVNAWWKMSDEAQGELKRVITTTLYRAEATDGMFYLKEGAAQDIRNEYLIF